MGTADGEYRLQSEESVVLTLAPLTPDCLLLPLSPQQRRIWSTDRQAPGDTTLNIAFCLEVKGHLDAGLLEAAINGVAAKHEILRSTCRIIDGEPTLVVTQGLSLRMPICDIGNLPKAERTHKSIDISTGEARTGFDLERGPLIRLGLIRFDHEYHIITLTMHSMIADGWSVRLVIDDLVRSYSARLFGKPCPLEPPAIQFADFLDWQADFLRGAECAAQIEYWKKRLVGHRPLRVVPDLIPAGRLTSQAEIISHQLSTNVVDGLKRFSDACGGTMFVTTLACLLILLREETGRDDVSVGTPVACRSRVEVEQIVGPLLNTAIVRAELTADRSFSDVERIVREAVLEAMANQDVPLEVVSGQNGAGPGSTRWPLHHVNFMCYRAFAGGESFRHELAGAQMGGLPSPSQGALHDLNLFIVERETGWRVSLEYRKALHSAAKSGRLLERYIQLLERLALDPASVASQLGVVQNPTPNKPGPEAVLPASLAQQRYWLLTRAAPQAATLNVPVAVRISGPLRVDLLEQALDSTLARHEALRTTFEESDGQLLQVIAPLTHVELTRTSVGNLPGGMREEVMLERLQVDARIPFDLERGPLIRAHLYELDATDYALQLTLHHAICDGQSVSVLQRDLWSTYEALEGGREPGLPALAIQYGDYSEWQRKWLDTRAAREHLAYWLGRLKAPLPIAEFPLDLHPAGTHGARAASEVAQLPSGLVVALRSLGQREHVTMFMMTAAAFAILLSKSTGQTDIMLGCPIANRNSDTDEVIGPFSSLTALRLDLPGNPTARQIIQQVRDAVLDAFAHGEMPFERIYREIHFRSERGRSPLFQFYFSCQRAFLQGRHISDLEIAPIPDAATGTPFELQFMVVEFGRWHCSEIDAQYRASHA